MATQFWNCYRYVRVRIRSVGSANQAFTFKIGSKEWDSTTDSDGTYVNRDFDLACPTNTSSTKDTQDSRFPLTASGGVAATQGDLWGVDGIGEIAFKNLTNGITYEIDSISLVRSSYWYYSALPEFQNWVDAYPDVGAVHTEFEPGFFTDADGRYSDPGYALVNVETAGVPAYSERSLTNLISDLGGYKGITATAAGSFPADGYHANSLCSYLIGGAGAVYTFSSSSWTEYVDRSTTTLQAQALWDQVEGYPGCGRGVWDGSAYNSASTTTKALPLAFTKNLRGSAKGIVFTTSDVPFPGATIAAYETSGAAPVGTGVSASNGAYETGTPFGRGNRAITTELQVPPLAYPTEDDTWQNRRRERTSFRRASVAQGAPSQDVAQDQLHIRAFEQGGNIWTGRRSNAAGASWTDADTGVAGTDPCIRFDSGKSLTAILVYTSGGNVYFRTSTDHGATWSSATSLGAGTGGCVAVGNDRLRYFYRVDGTDIKYDRRDATGVSLATGTAIAGVSAGTRVSASFQVESGGVGYVVLSYVTGGNVTRSKSRDGVSSWSTTSIAAGAEPEQVITHDKGEFRYYANGSDLKVEFRDATGAVLVSPTNVLSVDSGVGAGVATYIESGGAWKVSLLVIAGGVLIEKTSPDGKSFS